MKNKYILQILTPSCSTEQVLSFGTKTVLTVLVTMEILLICLSNANKSAQRFFFFATAFHPYNRQKSPIIPEFIYIEHNLSKNGLRIFATSLIVGVIVL